MKRRDLFKAAGAAAGVLAAPRLARAQNAGTLRFVPQANLPNIDPVWGTQYVVRNAALLVYDTLFGVDSKVGLKPQMVESWEVAPDGLTWSFRLRDGLKFHTGEPVLSRDVVASLHRWMVRDQMGQLIQARMEALEAVDDRNFRYRLRQPFPKMLFALGKTNVPMAVIMPERLAKTDPFQIVPEFVGSGPMAFKKDEFVAGAKAVFTRFDGYVPRSEPADWMAGGKRMLLDRIEWIIIPDAATAANALQNGEVDWVETPSPDLVPLLKSNSAISVDVADPLGNVGSFRMNHLWPPFNDVRARRAVQMALSQEDYMRAVVGDDTSLWKTMAGFFPPSSPLYTEAGGEALKGPRRYDEAKKLLAEAGYKGEKVVLLVATDVGITKSEGDVTADLLGKIGMNVDYRALDWSTVGSLRGKKDPPSQGGWNIFHTWHAGADCVNPAPYTALATTGPKAWFGWPDSPEITADIAAWYDADAAAEQAAIDKINRASMDFVTYVPTGFFQIQQAWRKNVAGVIRAPFPCFWGVRKT